MPEQDNSSDQSAAIATINGMGIPLVTPYWPYPTHEPYLPCCGVPVGARHLYECTNYRNGDHVPCPSCAMVGFHSANCPDMSGFDPVSRPSHYNSHPSGIETIRVNRCMTFCAGGAFKYVIRYKLKADPAEDLKKARFYLADCLAYDDPLFISARHAERALPLVTKMRDAEPNASVCGFLSALIDLDVVDMAAVVDQMRANL